jgi:flagellar basal-body rod protein FlgF
VIESLKAAAASLAADMNRMTSISQNLVNGATAGYKRELTATAPFERQMADAADAVDGNDTPLPGVTDHRLGTLRPTGSPLDLAIDGEGFFELRSEGRTLYTRRGDFRLDASGRLVSQAGEAVQGLGGAIQMPSANARIDRDGRVFDGEKQLAQIKVVRFADPRQLARLGGSLFDAAGAAASASDGAGHLRQGHLEASNVNNAAEMVKLIETVRHFEATQKIIQGIDEMTERALRKLGEF